MTQPYDSLIVGAGVGQSYFGHDEYSKWAPGMKTLADALGQRARIFGAFEMAELEDDPEMRRAWLSFVVVGGGPTGVEIAGQIAELSRRALKHNFRRLELAEARVLLFEGGPEILATFGDRLSGRATRELEKNGRRDPRAIDRHAPGRGRSRCQGAGRVGPAILGEDKDLGRRRRNLPSSENAGGRNRRGVRPLRSHQGETRLLITRLPGGVRGR